MEDSYSHRSSFSEFLRPGDLDHTFGPEVVEDQPQAEALRPTGLLSTTSRGLNWVQNDDVVVLELPKTGAQSARNEPRPSFTQVERDRSLEILR